MMNLNRLCKVWLFVLVTALFSAPALACRCSQLPLATYFQQAHWVGRVKVEKMHEPKEVDGGQARPVAIQVLAAHKGSGQLKQVYTADSHAACGMVLLPGSEYWVFARNRNIGTETWWIDSCTGTRPVGADFADVVSEDVAAALTTIAVHSPAADEAEESLHQRIRLTKIDGDGVTETMIEQFAHRALLSPNGAWRLIILTPPPEARPPHVVQVVVEREQAQLLALSLFGAEGLEKVEWVNEKLVLVQTIWGADRSKALLLDVQAGRILYVDGQQTPNRF